VNRKLPTIASFDTRADSNGIFHIFQFFLSETRICHRMARLAAGRAPGNPGTSASLLFHILHTQAEKADPARSRSTDKGDTTRVFFSQRTILDIFKVIP
jgi:hypothetical protein